MSVRQYLELPNYTSKTRVSQQTRQVLESTLDKVSNSREHIPIQDFSSDKQVEDTIDVNTCVHSIFDWEIELPEVKKQ